MTSGARRALTSSLILASAGENRRLNPTISSGAASSRATADATRSASLQVIASGFSTNTCLPASSARTAWSACS